MGRFVKSGSAAAGMPMVNAVRFPFAVRVHVFPGSRDDFALGNLRVAVLAPGIAGVAVRAAGRFYSAAGFRIRMVVRIQAAVFCAADGACRLVFAGGFAALVRRFVHNGSASIGTKLPVIVCVGLPVRSCSVAERRDNQLFFRDRKLFCIEQLMADSALIVGFFALHAALCRRLRDEVAVSMFRTGNIDRKSGRIPLCNVLIVLVPELRYYRDVKVPRLRGVGRSLQRKPEYIAVNVMGFEREKHKYTIHEFRIKILDTCSDQPFAPDILHYRLIKL